MSILEIIIYSLIGAAVITWLGFKLFKKPKEKNKKQKEEDED